MWCSDIISIITSIIENLFFTGAVFGWPALQYILTKQGYFSELCFNTNTSNSSITSADYKSLACVAAEKRFNLVFTLATSLMLICSLPFVFIMRRYGTWVSRSMATTLYTTAFIMLALMTVRTSGLIFAATIFIAVGGMQLLITDEQLGYLSPSFESAYVTMISGLFNTSAVTFIFVKLVYESGTRLETAMWTLTGLTAFLWLRTFLLMPKALIPHPLPSKYKLLILGRFEVAISKKDIVVPDETTPLQGEGASEDSEEDDWKWSATSCLFWSNAIHFCLTYLCFVCFIGSYVTWLSDFQTSSQIAFYISVFGYLCLASAILSPLPDLVAEAVACCLKNKIADKRKRKLRGLSITMAITCVFATLLAISAATSKVHPALAFVTLFRIFVFGGNADFLTAAFPKKHLDILLSITFFVAGVFSLFQYSLFALTRISTQGNHIANYTIVGLCIITFYHPVIVWIKSRWNWVNRLLKKLWVHQLYVQYTFGISCSRG